jgi:hypothetical protein
MSENNGTEKKVKLTLTLDPKTLIVTIDLENLPGPEIALNMLDQARREFDFQWHVNRGFQEQQRMEGIARGARLIRNS